MKITFDPVKREKTLRGRKLDFFDAPMVFGGVHIEQEDDRFDYGEGSNDDDRLSGGADGDRDLDATRHCQAHHLDEESE